VKRTPLVLGGTVAGLVGVLLFHTTPARSSFSTLPSASAPSGASGGSASAAAKSSAKKSSGKKSSGKSSSRKSSGQGSASASPAASASATRTATGPQVNYSWGVLAVKVTVSGKKITSVGIASIDDGGNPRSQMIDQQSIPLLEQQAMQAQSANIQGVSGASYTTQGFQQSLQGALQSLGLA
jgi:uncharacterized protein with FMN-binding domain